MSNPLDHPEAGWIRLSWGVSAAADDHQTFVVGVPVGYSLKRAVDEAYAVLAESLAIDRARLAADASKVAWK